MGADETQFYIELKGILKILLNSQTTEEIHDILDEESLYLDSTDAGFKFDANVTPKVGKPIS